MAGSNRRTAPPGRRRRFNYPRQGYGRVRRWVPSWRFAVGSVITVGFLGLGGIAAAYALVQVPDPSEDVEFQTTTVYYSDGTTPVGTFATQRRELVDFATLPDYVGNAVVSAEDRTFFENQGISVTGTLRAAWNNLRGGDTQGGSTLTQQYVERYYMGTTKDYVGKAKEAILAIKINQSQTKEEILGRYLNTIYFGRDTYGIEAAAQSYFGVPAAQLTLSQAAVLAGIIPSPNNWDPAVSPEKAQQRWAYVLDHMVEDGHITQAERDAQVFPPVQAYERSDTLGGPNGYILEQVRNELTATGTLTNTMIDTKGLSITTTIDKDAQAAAIEAGRKLVAGELSDGETPDGHLKVGIVSIDPADGAIVAMYSGQDFLTDQFNRVTRDAIQAGSTFKPFTLIAALEQGIPLTTTFNGNSPQTLPSWQGKSVSNFSGQDFGTIDLVKATEQSVNTVYAQLNDEVGPEETTKTAAAAGITTTMNPVPSNVLGSDPVHPLDMANAYATIAAQGMRSTPFIVREARYLSDDSVAYTGGSAPKQAFPADVMADTTYAMTQVVQNGSGERWIKPLGRDIAGKTGTSTDNKSAWFVGFTPQIATAVALSQVGENGKDQVPITPWGKDVRGRSLASTTGITGGTWPAALWAAYMQPVLALPQYATPVAFPPRANVGKAPTPTATASSVPVEPPPAVEQPAQPTTATVPSGLVKSLQADAEAALVNVGLTVTVTTQPSSSVSSGYVISVSPGSGAVVPTGSAVTLVVSSGPAVAPPVEPPPPEPTEPGATTAP
ncbi:MAG TPA: penicillin-binding protein [Friedmanniella sp.]